MEVSPIWGAAKSNSYVQKTAQNVVTNMAIDHAQQTVQSANPFGFAGAAPPPPEPKKSIFSSFFSKSSSTPSTPPPPLFTAPNNNNAYVAPTQNNFVQPNNNIHMPNNNNAYVPPTQNTYVQPAPNPPAHSFFSSQTNVPAPEPSFVDYSDYKETSPNLNSSTEFAAPTSNISHDQPLNSGQPFGIQKTGSMKEKMPETVQSAMTVANDKYLFTKQFIMEKLGKAEATSDPEVAPHLDKFWRIFTEFENIVLISFRHLANARGLRESLKSTACVFSEVGVLEKDMVSKPFEDISSIFRQLHEEADQLFQIVERLYDRACTFRNAAIDDCSITADKYEKARLNYDVAKSRLASAEMVSAIDPARVTRNSVRVNERKEEFKRIGIDLSTKIILLNEKRVQILTQEIKQYLNALRNYHIRCASVFTGMRSIEIKDFLKKDVTNDFKQLMLDGNQDRDKNSELI